MQLGALVRRNEPFGLDERVSSSTDDRYMQLKIQGVRCFHAKYQLSHVFRPLLTLIYRYRGVVVFYEREKNPRSLVVLPGEGAIFHRVVPRQQ